jgi:hypothetical protein
MLHSFQPFSCGTPMMAENRMDTEPCDSTSLPMVGRKDRKYARETLVIKYAGHEEYRSAHANNASGVTSCTRPTVHHPSALFTPLVGGATAIDKGAWPDFALVDATEELQSCIHSPPVSRCASGTSPSAFRRSTPRVLCNSSTL